MGRERNKKKANLPTAFERYSPTFRNNNGCDRRGKVIRRLAAVARAVHIATAYASWSAPWVTCGVSAGGTFHMEDPATERRDNENETGQ